MGRPDGKNLQILDLHRLASLKTALAGHFFSELQKCFQLALLLTCSLPTL